MTYLISKEIEFDAGHRVPNHKSKCKNPHGHRYKVKVHISGELVTTPGASNEGMLADFGDLKTIMTEKIHDVLDHGFIVYEHDLLLRGLLDAKFSGPVDFEIHEYDDARRTAYWEDVAGFKVIVFPNIPTAENLARWCYDQVVDEVLAMGFTMVQVDVHETPTSVATYASWRTPA